MAQNTRQDQPANGATSRPMKRVAMFEFQNQLP